MSQRRSNRLLAHTRDALLVGAVLGGAVFSAHSAEAPTFSTDLTLANLMESIVMPAADALWQSTAVDVSATGTEVTAPTSDEAWTRLRNQAITLAAATNLLLVPGLKVDTAPDAEQPGPGELGAAAIGKLKDANAPAWAAHVEVLHTTAMRAIEAIDQRNVDALSEVGGDLDAACESCHLQFWYPEG